MQSLWDNLSDTFTGNNNNKNNNNDLNVSGDVVPEPALNMLLQVAIKDDRKRELLGRLYLGFHNFLQLYKAKSRGGQKVDSRDIVTCFEKVLTPQDMELAMSEFRTLIVNYYIMNQHRGSLLPRLREIWHNKTHLNAADSHSDTSLVNIPHQVMNSVTFDPLLSSRLMTAMLLSLKSKKIPTEKDLIQHLKVRDEITKQQIHQLYEDTLSQAQLLFHSIEATETTQLSISKRFQITSLHFWSMLGVILLGLSGGLAIYIVLRKIYECIYRTYAKASNKISKLFKSIANALEVKNMKVFKWFHIVEQKISPHSSSLSSSLPDDQSESRSLKSLIGRLEDIIINIRTFIATKPSSSS
jgi:hypothetical protein